MNPTLILCIAAIVVDAALAILAQVRPARKFMKKQK
jgi:hypothetical protein